MLRLRLMHLNTMILLSCVATAALWSGCGGSTESVDSNPGAGGTQDSDAATGGAGGTSGSGGTGVTGGSGGTGVTGGSGGTGTGGTSVPPDGSVPDAADDAPLPDAPPDAACQVFGESCDPNGDSCCAPLSCVDGPNGARCRLEPSDAGLDGALCAAPQQPCTQLDCCPGLVCIPQGPTEICRLPYDGGMPEGGMEGGTCNDLFEACGSGHGPCCQGLECKTDPPQYPDRQCLPKATPDPDDCPTQEPQNGSPCAIPGLQCPYGNMTVCMCYVSGWQCAY